MVTFLGIDCGASSLRIGIVSDSGELLKHVILESPLKTNPENLAEVVKTEVIRIYSEIQNLAGIGLGVPGTLDIATGIVLSSPNIRQKSLPLDIARQFEVVFNTKISLDRDTNVALLGESWKGGAVSVKNVVMLSVGTGVGGAILVDGKLYRGRSNKGAEIGHMYISVIPAMAGIQNNQETGSRIKSGMTDGLPRCGYGHEGCLEALMNSTEDLDTLGTYLGYGLSNIVNIFNPELILLAGGKFKLGDFLPKAISVMKEEAIKSIVDEVRVEYAKLGDMAGVYGAARLSMDKDI